MASSPYLAGQILHTEGGQIAGRRCGPPWRQAWRVRYWRASFGADVFASGFTSGMVRLIRLDAGRLGGVWPPELAG
jgi:hypothetical protein